MMLRRPGRIDLYLARGVLGVVTAAVVLRCLLVRPVHPQQVAGHIQHFMQSLQAGESTV